MSIDPMQSMGPPHREMPPDAGGDGGGRRALIIGLIIVVVIAVLVIWQPWGQAPIDTMPLDEQGVPIDEDAEPSSSRQPALPEYYLIA